MKCPSCGGELVAGSRFCKYCGSAITMQTTNDLESDNKVNPVVGKPENQTNSQIQNIQSESMTAESDITKGCKIWFWFVLIMNAISALSSLALMSYSPTAGMIGMISGIVLCAGAAIILFKKKKVGFYMIAAMAVIVLIFNLTSGANAAVSIIAAIANPIISYYFVNKNANIIQ